MKNKYVDAFLKEWELQQGALFLKQDEIYGLRRELCEYFFRKGYQVSEDTGEIKVEDVKPIEAGEYVIEFGRKYKGKKIKDIPKNNLEGYLFWLQANTAIKPQSPLGRQVERLIKNFEEFYGKK